MSKTIEGLDELTRQLKGLKALDLSEGRASAAEIVRSAIVEEAPRGPTGNLKRGIAINPGRLSKRPDNVTFVASDYSIAPHAHLVEFGARGGSMPANPFFSRGFEKSKSAAGSALAGNVPKAIDKAIS